MGLFDNIIKKFKNEITENTKEEKKVDKKRPEDAIYFDGLVPYPPIPTTDNIGDIRDGIYYNKDKNTLYVSELVVDTPEFINYQEELQLINRDIILNTLTADEFSTSRKEFLLKRGPETQEVKIGSSRRVNEAKGILRDAMEKGASDIHIDTNTEKNLGILHFRIGGVLQEQKPINNPEELLRVIFNQLAEGSDSTFMPDRMQNATITDRNNMPDGMIGVRIVSAPHYNGTFMVMRLQKKDSQSDMRFGIVPRLLRLGYTMRQAFDWQRIMRKPTGMVIISGKVGSGKTKTLAVIAECLQHDNPGLMIQTVENPIEIPIPGVRQQSIKTGYGQKNKDDAEAGDDAFSQGINVALRSDPNILVISEVRTPEEALSAFKGADTGHLLFTTIHANGALPSIPRFQSLLPSDKIPDPYLHMSDTEFMNGCCYQRLVQVLCNHCKIPINGNEHLIDPDMLDRIKGATKGDPDLYNNIYIKGKGCKFCSNRGYSGRTVIAEVIAFTSEILDVYGTKRNINDVRIKWHDIGGMDFRHIAKQRFFAGMISPETYEQNCGDLYVIDEKEKL